MSVLRPTEIEFDGANTQIDCGSGASLDDLADNAFTVEAWIRADSYGEGNLGRIADKKGWLFYISNTHGVIAEVDCATTDAYSSSGLDDFTADGRWYHVAMFFDDAGDRKCYIAVDGQWVSAYGAQNAGVGAIVTDAGEDLIIGNNSTGSQVRTFDGAFAWVRISDNDRYSHGVDFTPPSRIDPPDDDANTVSLWKMDEGAGTTVADSNANANDGTLTVGTGGWLNTFDLAQDASAERIFNWGYVFGAENIGDGISQVDTGLSAGSNYVWRFIIHEDLGSDVEVVLWDATNDSLITAIQGGADSTRDVPWICIATAELPTIAQSGVVADCTAVRWYVKSTVAGQGIRLHQAEVQTNEMDNPSYEDAWAGGILKPQAWTLNNASGPELSREVAIIHSGFASVYWNTDGFFEFLRDLITLSTGQFVAAGAFIREDDPTLYIADFGNKWALQSDPSVGTIQVPTDTEYNHALGVVRAKDTSISLCFGGYNNSAEGYVDDAYGIILDDISLTVTPASEANSTESAGLRVDGLDSLTQPIPAGSLGATSGKIRFNWTPRHGAGDFEDFGVVNPLLCTVYKSGSDQLNVITPNNTHIQISIKIAGVTTTGIGWDATGIIAAGTTYLVEIEYDDTDCTLTIDGTLRDTATPGAGIDWGANIPDTLFAGTNGVPEGQSDAVFGNPP